MTVNDAITKLETMPEHEPVFIVRGQDICAVETVLCWTKQALDEGAPVAKIRQALDVADAMKAWPHKKVPD